MADILVTSPFQPFTLPTQFKAVFNGYIYCGTVDAVDPSVSQVQVYLVNEAGDKVPVAQPLRTNAGGFLVYNGQPAKFVTDSSHSLLVQDANHVQLWYSPNLDDIDPASFMDVLAGVDGADLVGSANYAQIRAYTGTASKIDCYGRTNVFDGANGVFVHDPSDATSADNDGTILIDALGRRWKRQYRGAVHVDWFGATPNGGDSANAILNAFAAVPVKGGQVEFSPGVYSHSATLTVPSFVQLLGAGDIVDETAAGRGTTLLKTADVHGIVLGPASGMSNIVSMGNNGLAGDGIRVFGHSVRLVNVFTTLHGGDGLNIGGDGTVGGSANCNNWHMDCVTSRSNKGAGFKLLGYDPGTGPDVNNGLALHCTANYNGSKGFDITNAIVNTFVQCYAEGNIGKGFDLGTKCQNTTFVNCGSEGNAANDPNGQFVVSGANAYNNLLVGSHLYNVYDPAGLMQTIKSTGGVNSNLRLSNRIASGDNGFPTGNGTATGYSVSGALPGHVIVEPSAALDRKSLSMFSNGGNTFFRFYKDTGGTFNDWFRTFRNASGGVDRTSFTGGVTMTGALGVGNSVAAVGPVGTIVGKFQILDANGAGIGYVPIYSNIT